MLNAICKTVKNCLTGIKGIKLEVKRWEVSLRLNWPPLALTKADLATFKDPQKSGNAV